jgi:tRNA threonylcarbamoyl adenosine modification protein YjeE
MKIYQSFSSRETKKLGERIAKRVKKIAKRKGALVFALQGDLGVGKTTFVQGFTRTLGSKKRATSPTFIIMRRHPLKKSKKTRQFKNVFHIDAYRLKTPKHLQALGFKQILSDPANVILLEWAERVKKILPRTTIWLKFQHGKKENERKITVKNGL